jgi:processive 1,2-diacylglycerol beta-glucosyltransferase
VLILTIGNGAGHTRAGEAIAAALCVEQPSLPVMVIDVADYMTRTARFTHVTAYLWLVKHAPVIWKSIDAYQKRQPRTSPEWYYQRGCHKLFDLARALQPRALVATEVGCGEIAALIKRDLRLRVPLIAVNVNYDVDRAWVKPETDLYCVPTEAARDELIAYGAARERTVAWGVPMAAEFNLQLHLKKEEARAKVCRMLNLDARLPIVLIAGGSEGMGQIQEVINSLLRLPQPPQLIVLAGRNARLKWRCEQIGWRNKKGARPSLRVLGWTEHVPLLMRAADLMVSKLGNTFDEAMVAELPLVALKPPPGSERVQYRLLEEWNVGRAVHTLDEMAETVSQLLADGLERARMRKNAHLRARPSAAVRLARWLSARCEEASAGRDRPFVAHEETAHSGMSANA